MREIDDPAFIAEVSQGIPLDELQRKLMPGSYSGVGFLGDHEGLLEVVQSDWEVVRGLGTTHSEISEALVRVVKGEQSPTPGFEFKTTKDLYRIRIETAGDQFCPWDDNSHGQTIGILFRTEVLEDRLSEIKRGTLDIFDMSDTIRSPNASSLYVVVTGLLPHLIREHSFFEGKKSPYRADPTLLIQALGLSL